MRSALVLAKPKGSKPTSPTRVPSSAAGRSIKGRDWLILGRAGGGGVTSSSTGEVTVSSGVASAMRSANVRG